MKYTNLELVQKILSSMDSDEINSISDTSEARQVLDIVQTVYFDIAAVSDLPRDYTLFQLTPSTDPTRPVTMTLPSDVTDIHWIKYDTATISSPTTMYEIVYPMALHDFLAMVSAFDPTETDVITYTIQIGTDTHTFYAKNNGRPQYYTTLDDNTVLFDSYDAAVDSTLQQSKTQCYGQKTFAWSATDAFIAPLDEKQHQQLLHEAKALAFAELKQSVHAKAEKTAREIKINQQSAKTKIPLQTALDKLPNYGRRTRGRTKPDGRYH